MVKIGKELIEERMKEKKYRGGWKLEDKGGKRRKY